MTHQATWYPGVTRVQILPWCFLSTNGILVLLEYKQCPGVSSVQIVSPLSSYYMKPKIFLFCPFYIYLKLPESVHQDIYILYYCIIVFLYFCIFVFLYFCIFVFLYFCIFVFLYFVFSIFPYLKLQQYTRVFVDKTFLNFGSLSKKHHLPLIILMNVDLIFISILINCFQKSIM